METTLWAEQARIKLATVVDKQALEKAFMDQSYGFVANRAGDLFKDPHRLGFEVVFKNNDETPTRMVGLFAFRLGKRLLYAPVFFLNGTIKGYDLLYRHWIKKFCPSTTEWVQFLISSAENDIGSPIGRAEAGKLRNSVNFASIAGPPVYKSAAIKAEWEALLDEMSEQRPIEPVLEGFLCKHASDGMLDRLADLIDRSVDFADAIAKLPDDHWCPPLDKLAAKCCEKCGPSQPCVCKKPGKLEVHDSLPSDATTKEAADFYQDGYLLRDKRAAETLADAAPTLDVATGIPGPGKFRVMVPGGGWRTMIAAYEATDDLTSGDYKGGCNCCPPSCGSCSCETHRPIILVDTESNDCATVNKAQDVVIDDGDAEGAGFSGGLGDLGEDKPSTGSTWRILDATTGTLSRPFYVHSVKAVNDITVCPVSFYNTKADPDCTIRINPDAPYCSLPDCVVNNSARFIRVSSDIDSTGYIQYPSAKAQPGNLRDFDHWVMSHEGLSKKACLRLDHGLWRVEYDGTFFEDDRRGAHLKLASMGLPADVAEAMLDNVTETRTPETFWIIKRAYPTRQADRENFYDTHDPQFGVEQEQPRQALLRTETQRIRNAVPGIGDALDPSMGAGPSRRTSDPIPQDLMSTVTPEQLQQIATTQGLPNVFEHGAIGAMIKTYDSLAMIETYLPVFDDALDRLGRCLFLFYFKPSDFEKAYGTDDMQTQENDYLNAIKVMGDLTLGLLKRQRSGGEASGSAVQYNGTEDK
jgi:hypothetical protein